jgi:hypothetical protein
MSDTEVAIGPYVVGEKPPPLEYSFLDSNGAAIDLSGYTAKFVCKEADSAAVTVNATVTTPLSGTVEYVWDGTEFATPGSYRAEFWAGNGTNRYASLVMTFQVRSPVGPVPNI